MMGFLRSAGCDNTLPDIVDWSRANRVAERQWLMLGKGPSYRKLSQVDTSAYGLLALNHVVREQPVDIAHAIDLDVVHDCGEAMLRNAGVLWMPAYPHIDSLPSRRALWDWAREIPVLRELAAQGRLAWYNSSTCKQRVGESPVVQVKFFSAEAALHALAIGGATTVRSLGVDGGSRYDPAFKDLAATTLLANGRISFDRQFEGIARILMRTKIFYAPLTVKAPVKVFVGTDSTQLMGLKLLEYSIRRHASLSVEVEAIDDRDIPSPRDPKQRARTGFSFSRFRIPELCGYRGRAIYLDADMQVFTDIARLWNIPLDGAELLYADGVAGGVRQPQFSVMLLDCAALDWDVRKIVQGLDEGRYDYAALMQKMCIVRDEAKRAGIPSEWNSLEHYEAGRTHLLHYTDMPTQPWISKSNPNGLLFYKTMREAIDAGFISRALLYEEVQRGHVSPDLPRWLSLPPPDGHARLLREWTPPFRRLVAPAPV